MDTGGAILPLLDGLDEMDEAARPTCITVINTYHSTHLHPLVVSCRTNEYDAATVHERFALHTAVIVQPLTLEQIDAHLVTIGKPLIALRTALKGCNASNTGNHSSALAILYLPILASQYKRFPPGRPSTSADLERLCAADGQS